MKRIIILAMALVMMLVSIGGCWPWGHEGDRGGGHQRNEERIGGETGGSGGGPGGHAGPGGAGGGH